MEGQTTANPGGLPNQELTYGGKAVGITFNPGGNEEVNRAKAYYANIIDMLDQAREVAKKAENFEKVRLYSVAITEAQTAQMWAVKAITWQF